MTCNWKVYIIIFSPLLEIGMMKELSYIEMSYNFIQVSCRDKLLTLLHN